MHKFSIPEPKEVTNSSERVLQICHKMNSGGTVHYTFYFDEQKQVTGGFVAYGISIEWSKEEAMEYFKHEISNKKMSWLLKGYDFGEYIEANHLD